MYVGPCPLRLIAPTFAELCHLGLSCWSRYPLSQCQMRNGGCQERALHWPRAKMASMNKHMVPRSWSHVSKPQFLFCSQHTPLLMSRCTDAGSWGRGDKMEVGRIILSLFTPPHCAVGAHRGPSLPNGPPASSAPFHPALSWPPDFPSCAMRFLPAFPGAGAGLALLQNGLIRINPEKAHVLFIPAKVK